MQALLLFWIAAAGLGFAVLGLVVAPLIRSAGPAERRASYDMQVYRDQLREIDADRARGVLGPDEAEAVRAEIARRLLAAADAEAAEAAAAGAPRGLTLTLAAALALFLVLGGAGLYASLGAPFLPDQPRAGRLDQLAEARVDRPGQDEVEAPAAGSGAPAAETSPEDLALVEQLIDVLETRPEDVEGHRLLARSEAALGRWPEARAAQERVLDLLGPAAEARDHVDLAEFMIIAAAGYVSPEAEDRLAQGLELAPQDAVARYYSGLALLQGGRPDLTLRLWSRLLSEGPPDAPWITPITQRIDEVAARAGQPGPAAPTRDAVTAAGDDAAAETEAMISTMVARLSDRLALEGGPPEDWARLIRSLGVLGRAKEADSIWREAHDTFAADPEAVALLRGAARDAGVTD